MTDHPPADDGQLRDLFVEITGETTLEERQRGEHRERGSRRRQSDPDADDLSTYVAETVAADGLEDAIDAPDGAASGSDSYG